MTTVPLHGAASWSTVGSASADARALVERQAEVLELIAAAAPLHEVLTRILVSLEHLMPGARCSVLLLDRDRGTLHHGAAPSLPAAYVAAIDGLAIADGAGSCGTAAAVNAPVVASDIRTDPRWVAFRDAALAAGVRSCWSTPIEGPDGLPVGTFAVYHPEPRRPTRREEQLVERFTHLTSVAIAHASLLGCLVESEERFRRSFDDNPLGMAILDLDRTVATSNHTLTTLVGEDPSGRTLTALLTPRGDGVDQQLDELAHAGAGRLGFEAALHRVDHRDVEVEVTVSRLRGRDGEPAQYVVNVFDLTERRAAERDRRACSEAETARRTAEELSHAKSELLAAVGHEVRTPIQAIVGFAELLGTMDLDEARRREALGHIDAAAGHVMDLLADVLDLSRLEVNALPLVLEPVSLREVVAEVFALLSAQAEQRQVELSHDALPDPAYAVAHADPRRLRQVLLNLVGNAIRHGNTGGRVSVRTRHAPDDTNLVITVDDDGPGLPDDVVPRIFTPFPRGCSPAPSDLASRQSSDESIGLGLGLAHGLAHAMGGDLSVRSSSPAGTSMLLRIPRVAPH